jgi:hypothetical protein
MKIPKESVVSNANTFYLRASCLQDLFPCLLLRLAIGLKIISIFCFGIVAAPFAFVSAAEARWNFDQSFQGTPVEWLVSALMESISLSVHKICHKYTT